jgi:hypothetical protein
LGLRGDLVPIAWQRIGPGSGRRDANQLRRHLGPAHIGLTVVVKSNAITGGHYFYAKYLTDIPLTGTMKVGSPSFDGEDGGAFALAFVGNEAKAESRSTSKTALASKEPGRRMAGACL